MAINKLTVGGMEIPSVKSVTYKETVNSGVDLRPGCVSSAFIEAEVYGTQADAVAPGAEVSYYLVDADSNETLIGVFTAEPSIKTKNSYKFVAYDNANKLNMDFSAWLRDHQADFPMTRAALVAAACTIAGVTNATPNWTGSAQTVQAFYADGLTCRDILSYAAELSGFYVHCHANGQLYFHWYTATPNTRIYPSSGVDGSETRYAYKQDGLNYANYTVPAIDGVAVHPSGEEDVAYIYPASPAGDNLLHIRDNILLTGAAASVYNAAAQRIYTQMTAVGAYVPATASMFANECPYESGETVLVTDIQGVSFKTIVMSKTITASGVVLESTGNEQQESGYENTQKALTQLASDVVQINKLKVSWAEIDQAIINYLTANDVTAQNLTIVDANDNVIATFNSGGITFYNGGNTVSNFNGNTVVLGKTSDTHAVLDYSSLELLDKDGNVYLHFGDARNANGRANVRWLGYENAAVIPYVSPPMPGLYSVIAVYVGGQLVDPSNYTYDTTTMKVTINTGVSDAEVDIRYVTTDPVYAYTLGYRNTSYYNGKQSLTVGRAIGCSARDSIAVGLDHAVAGEYNAALGGTSADIRAYYSVTLGGQGLIARSSSQTVLGEFNRADRAQAGQRGDYVEIVGNGTSNTARSNARTLDWSGNEWLAGQINANTGNFRSGATSSGNIDITGGYVQRRLPAAPTTGTAYWLAQVAESNGSTNRGGVYFFPSSSGGEAVALSSRRIVSGSSVSNELALYIDDSGNRTVSVSEQVPWRKALSLAYMPGDSFTFGTGSYTIFAGAMRADKVFNFTIPLQKMIDPSVSTITISGQIVLVGVNTSAKYKVVTLNDPSSAPTDACNTTVINNNAAGITCHCEFSVSQSSWWTAHTSIAVQAYGLTVSFS